jgi:hypothetical protein
MIPTVEGQVLQNFLDENGRLPRWNVAFNAIINQNNNMLTRCFFYINKSNLRFHSSFI